jgi:FkbM family methyltransferase
MQSKLFAKNIFSGSQKMICKLFTNEAKKAGLNWVKIKYLKHLPAGRTRSYGYKNKNIFYSSPQEMLHSLKEIFIEEIYKVGLPSKPLIIDCGANIGLSIIYFKENHKDAEILAFEPDEANFNLLKKNIQSFGLQDVSIKKEAVWIKETELNFSNEGTMASKIEHVTYGNARKVKAIRLKDQLNKKIDFLKIDIEGAEFEVLKDIKDNLHYVQNMFFEYHGNFEQNKELLEIFEIITKAGFSYYIKEAAQIYRAPFTAKNIKREGACDIQLNIFCFRLLNNSDR